MFALIAIGHIVGAIIVLAITGIGALILYSWESERQKTVALQEASLLLGISVDEFDNTEHQERILQFSAERYSSELLSNRLSDFCGWIQKCWEWISILFQACILLGVIWHTFTNDLSNGVHAWWVIAIALFFLVLSVIFGYACKLLTGRFPGQARRARKLLAEAMERRRGIERVLDGA